MDPLSDVLSLLKLRSYNCGGFDVGACSIRIASGGVSAPVLDLTAEAITGLR